MILPQLLVVATLGAADLSQLGYPGTAVTYGLGVEYQSQRGFLELGANYSPARKSDATNSWSVVGDLNSWAAFGSGPQILVGGGLSYSHTDATAYVTKAWRSRLGFGGYLPLAWGSGRLTIDWLQPLDDAHKLKGLEANARVELGKNRTRLRLSGNVGAYQFEQPGRPGTTSARTYGGAVGVTF